MHIGMCYSSWGSSCELSLSAPVSQHPAGPQEMLVNGRGQKKGRNGLYHCEKVDLPFLESGLIVSIWSPSGVWLIAKSRGEGGCSHAFPGVQKLRLEILICLGRNKCKMAALLCSGRISGCEPALGTGSQCLHGVCHQERQFPALGLK